MESFYGGPKGQDFEIAEVFTSKYEMDKDLAKSWTSPIYIGQFVMVSYGIQSDDTYATYKAIDLDAYGASYNSTLWRKDYTEDGTGSAAGLKYTLIASMTGSTPRISLSDTEVLDADQDPNVVWDNSDIEELLLTFQLPQSQVLGLGETTILDCNQEPSVSYDDSDINNPLLNFSLPKSQVIDTVELTVLNADETPTVGLDITDINNPTLTIGLPIAQLLQQGETVVLDADQDPYFSIDFTNVNQPVISFALPQSQVLAAPETTVVGPTVDPSVVLDDTDVNNPKLIFSLPDAVNFYYGSLLGSRTDGTYTVTDSSFEGYHVGDYYINAATGFTYVVTAVDGTTVTFEYVACLQSPLPSVVANSIDPYIEENGTYTSASPTVSRGFTNDEETEWQLTFELPTAPVYSVTFDFIGVDETGSVTTEIVSTDTVNFDFQIPRGSKIYSGTEISTSGSSTAVDGALVGDIYVNSSTGIVYTLNEDGSWVASDGELKGPVGDALNVIASYTINETETYSDSLVNGSAYIEENYSGEIDNSMLFAVTWVEYDTSQETSYWYFKTEDGVWARVQLTGGVENLITSEYDDEADGEVTNKTYSVNYTNTLIGGDVESKDKDLVTYSARQIEELLSWGLFTDLIT